MADRPPALLATIAYRPGDGPDAPAGLPVVRLVAGGTRLADDLHSLLYRRLRFATTLVAVLYAYFAGGWAMDSPLAYDFARFTPRKWAIFVIVNGIFLFESAAAVLLWSRRSLSLRWLRRLELAVVGLPFLHQCYYEYVFLFDKHLLRKYVEEATHSELTGRGHVLSWVAMVIGYAVFIPNTWRRCMVIVLVIVATALGLTVAAAAADGLLGVPLTLQHLREEAFWLAFAATFAVYNSYRIDTLRAATAAARQLGQYVLTEKLGAGGMGEVYRAEHALLRRPAAIKLIRPERAGDPATLARFEREVQATATLAHPNTVQIYDYGRADDGTFYCVMEYLPGLTLDQLVATHGPLPPGRAAFLLRQLCAALAEAHGIGLIHRDVKPGNAIVGGPRRPDRLGETARLRAGPRPVGRRQGEPGRGDRRDAGVHGPGAGEGVGRRSPVGRVRGRGGRLLPAGRPTAVRPRFGHGHPGRRPDRAARAAGGRPAGRSGRLGRGRHEVSREGSRRPLRVGRRPRSGPGRLRGRGRTGRTPGAVTEGGDEQEGRPTPVSLHGSFRSGATDRGSG